MSLCLLIIIIIPDQMICDDFPLGGLDHVESLRYE